MKLYFKYFIAIFALLFTFNLSSSAFAEDKDPRFINKIVLFGDSLSDNGNLYWYDWGFLPKSPPYFAGRFSNGNVWSEHLIDHFTSLGVQSTNFAIGGLTSIFHNPIKGFLPYSLTLSLDSYLLRTAFRDRAHTLFILWVGSNDYLPGTDQPEKLSTEVVANIKATIESLIYHGGLNFLVLNLPDLATTPYAKENNVVPLLSNLTLLHNTKLTAAIEDIQKNYPQANIHLFNINQLLADFLKDPNAVNKKYQTHITQTETSCWRGGYTLRGARAEKNVEAEIARQLDEQIQTKSRTLQLANEDGKPSNTPTPPDSSAFAHYIAATPTLLESYNVGSGKGKLCNNPDDYVFWDHIHPTSVIHKLLSQTMVDYIDLNYTINK